MWSREMSTIFCIVSIKRWPAWPMLVRNARSRGSLDASRRFRRSVAYPRITLSGVRISWLMLASSTDFSRLARSASIRACRSASSVRRRSVESRTLAIITRRSPSATSPTASSIGKVVPSPRRPVASRAAPAVSASASGSTTSARKSRPTRVPGACRKRCSPAGLMDSITPWASKVTIPSGT